MLLELVFRRDLSHRRHGQNSRALCRLEGRFGRSTDEVEAGTRYHDVYAVSCRESEEARWYLYWGSSSRFSGGISNQKVDVLFRLPSAEIPLRDSAPTRIIPLSITRLHLIRQKI